MKHTLTILIILLPFIALAQSGKGTFKVRKIKDEPRAEGKLQKFRGQDEKIVVGNFIEPIESASPAIFPGGRKAMLKFIVENIEYPTEEDEKNKFKGTVQLLYSVNKKGKVTDVKVLSGQGKLMNKEAVRVIKSMPKWTPREKNGLNLKSPNHIVLVKFKPN